MISEPLRSRLGPLVLRLGLALILLSHGALKLLVTGGTAWAPAGANLPPSVQMAVAILELVTGVLLALGLFTRIAALVVAVMQTAAIFLVTGQREFIDVTENMAKPNVTTFTFEPGYEYNVALIAMCVALICLGAGALAVDDLLRRRLQAPVPEPQPQPLQPTPA